jgi:hypothetical protein
MFSSHPMRMGQVFAITPARNRPWSLKRLPPDLVRPSWKSHFQFTQLRDNSPIAEVIFPSLELGCSCKRCLPRAEEFFQLQIKLWPLLHEARWGLAGRNILHSHKPIHHSVIASSIVHEELRHISKMPKLAGQSKLTGSLDIHYCRKMQEDTQRRRASGTVLWVFVRDGWRDQVLTFNS